MKTALILLISFVAPMAAGANESLPASYKLPLPEDGREILATPIAVLQTSTKEVSEQTLFGNRIYKPFISIIESPAENQMLLVKEEDSFTLDRQTDGSPWIQVRLTGQPVFFQVRGNYLDGVKVDPKATQVELPLSSLEFDQEEGDWEWIRYKLFVAMDEIPPVFQNDIRANYRGSMDAYIKEYGRFDSRFGMDETPQNGLRVNKFQKREGYVFSTCVEFEDRRPSDRPVLEGDCYVYSLAEISSVLPIIPGKNLRNYPQMKGLYLIERERKLRNDDEVQKHWIKVIVAEKSFVSLRGKDWKK